MIPTHPDRMNKGWIEEKLNARKSSLTRISSTPIGTGQMCDSYRLDLNWQGHNGPSSIVAKCPSGNEASRNIAKMVHNYELEVIWYRDVIPNAGADNKVNCPHCFYAEIDDNMVDFVLLLDDVSPARQGDQINGVDENDVIKAIDELAILHSQYWNDESLETQYWAKYGQANKELVRNMLPALYVGFRERYADRLSPDILSMGDDLIRNIDRYLDKVPPSLSIVHGDYRLDNLLFAPDKRVIIVDWQTIGIGSPYADLSYFIGTSIVDSKIRRDNELKWLNHYIKQVTKNGIIIDKTIAWDQYRQYAFSGFIMSIFASMNVERTERGDEMFAVMAERPAQQALDLKSIEMIVS